MTTEQHEHGDQGEQDGAREPATPLTVAIASRARREAAVSTPPPGAVGSVPPVSAPDASVPVPPASPPRSLFERIASVEALTRAWEDVQDRDAEDGIVSDSVKRFAKDAAERIQVLVEELVHGEYRPGPLFRVEIPKSNGEMRVLHVPRVRDRVIERAVHEAVQPFVDVRLGPGSFAYRPGLSVRDAVQEVVHWRESGHRWALRSDVDDCFPSIPADAAVRKLIAVLPDRSLDGLVRSIMRRRAEPRGTTEFVPGLPQGIALSPLVANLFLEDLDRELFRFGFPIVRYADDFVVACREESHCRDAAEVALSWLKEVGMTLSDDKTHIMSFDDGFAFLGEEFGPKLPPDMQGSKPSEPTRRTVYVGVQGSRIRKAQGRVIVESPDEQELINLPMSQIKRFVLFGSVGLSAGVRSWALAEGVGTVFLSRKGNYLGSQTSAQGVADVRRRRAQFRVADDPELSLPLAREIVRSKLAHQQTLLRRFPSVEDADENADAVSQIQNCMRMTELAAGRDELMGLEGAAAQVYFRRFGALVPEPVRFELRSRRPPRDVMNSALGYGYAVLLGECVSALVAAGLDPAVGLLHAEEGNRPSLALDLMEEFRPYVVDQVVIELARRSSLTKAHGRDGEEGGVLLTKEGKSVLLIAYERRMVRKTAGALPDFRGSIRRHLYRQAQRIANYVEEPSVGWTGLSWR